jgi:hypothetical protein
MKRIIISFLLLLMCYCSFSQNEKSGQTNFGLYAGGNVSQLLTDSVTNTKARIGYQYGAFVRYGNNFFIRGDVGLFSMSSQLIDAADTLQIISGMSQIEDKIDIQYIHIPILLGIKLFKSPDGTSSVWLAAGGYLDQIYKVKPNDLNLIKSDFNTTSTGISLSAGLDLWFLTFQIGYNRGLTPMFKIDDQSLKYSVFFSAGLKF